MLRSRTTFHPLMQRRHTCPRDQSLPNPSSSSRVSFQALCDRIDLPLARVLVESTASVGRRTKLRSPQFLRGQTRFLQEIAKHMLTHSVAVSTSFNFKVSSSSSSSSSSSLADSFERVSLIGQTHGKERLVLLQEATADPSKATSKKTSCSASTPFPQRKKNNAQNGR